METPSGWACSCPAAVAGCRPAHGRWWSSVGVAATVALWFCSLPACRSSGFSKSANDGGDRCALLSFVAGCPSAVGAVAGFGRQSGVDHHAGRLCAPSTMFVFAPARTNMVHGTQRPADGPTDRLRSCPRSQRSQVRAVVDNPSTAQGRPATNARPEGIASVVGRFSRCADGSPASNRMPEALRRRSWPLFEVRRRFAGGEPDARSAAPA